MPPVLRLAGIAIGTIIALWLTYHVLKALRSGTANVHNTAVRRRGRPLYYWAAVVAQMGFAVMLYVVVVASFSRLLSN